METPSAELCSCQMDTHVVASAERRFARPEMPAGEWDADVVELGRTVSSSLQDSRTVCASL